MKKSFTIFLILIVALSSVGMSVSQHFCKMSKEEIEKSACEMCASKDHGKDDIARSKKKSCCTDKAVHLRLATDATSSKTPQAPAPAVAAPLHETVLSLDESNDWTIADLAVEIPLPSFPLAEEHTVLRV